MKVFAKQNESNDQVFRRFRKKIMRNGVLNDVKRKRWFVSKSETRRIKKKKAARMNMRRQRAAKR